MLMKIQWLRRIAVLLALSVLPALLFSCGPKDLPPDDGSPWPAGLDGTFVFGDSSLVFNGDGQTVRLDLETALAERMSLPAGESDGTYVFLFQNKSWRYDFAESLRFMVGETSSSFAVTPGSTTSLAVSFRLGDGETVRFEKQP